MSGEKSTPAAPWRDRYPVHPCADVFPMMNNAEIDTLAEDIRVHGLQQPVLLWRAPSVPRKRATFLVLDGRNRLEALTRLGVAIPSPDDPREMIDFPGGGQIACVFIVANDQKQWASPQVQDPAEFVIGANIRRRHLTKEQQAELIVKTIAVGDPNDRAKAARSFSPRRGKKGGSTKDVVLAKAVTEAQKHGISKRTVQNARAKLHGTKKIDLSSTPPRSAARPLTAPSTSERVDRQLTENAKLLDRVLRVYTELDVTAPELTPAERRIVCARLLVARRCIDQRIMNFGGTHKPAPGPEAWEGHQGGDGAAALAEEAAQ